MLNYSISLTDIMDKYVKGGVAMNISSISSYQNHLNFGFLAQQTRKDQQSQKTEQKEEEVKSIYGGNFLQNQEDSVLQSLEEQLARNQQEKEKLAQNTELTAEEKLDKKKELDAEQKGIQEQISQRQMQIQEEEREKEQRELEEKIEKTIGADDVKKETDPVQKAQMDVIATAATVMGQAGNLTRMKVTMEGRERIAQAQLRTAKQTGGATAGSYREIAHAQSAVAKINQKLGSILSNANEKIKEEQEELKEETNEADDEHK